MAVDVVSEITIDQPRAEVAAFACDPDNAARWYENIEAVEWVTQKPLTVGTRVRFVARFLGRRLAYTYEVKDWLEGERFVMSTAEGPFPMETTYRWSDADGRGTVMQLRNRGEPSGFSSIAAPLVERAMRKANRKDLDCLKRLLESPPQS